MCLRRETNRQAEIKELTSKGIIPHDHEMQKNPNGSVAGRSWLIGKVAALIHDVLPAQVIIDQMVGDACKILTQNALLVNSSMKSKL
jgi:hypothetical protein